MKFYIGSVNGSGIETNNFDDFVEYLRDMVEIAEKQGEENFDINVETYLTGDDEEEIELPNEVIVELSELNCCLNDEEEIKDCVVDFLTDEIGFCIRRCDISLEDEGIAKVTNIDWDTED